jgi:hypothetical protein
MVLRGKRVAARLAAPARTGKLASLPPHRHKRAMRPIVPFLILLMAACAPRPSPTPVPPAPAASTAPRQFDHRTINGMTAGELIIHFGKPRLQIVEGEGTKLQFAGSNCVLDVYLYPPPGGGTPRATLIEARNAQGSDVSAQSCAATLEKR